MNFSKYRFNFSSDDDGTFWPGVIELPVEDKEDNNKNSSKFNTNPRILTAIGLIILLSVFFINKNSAYLLLIFAVFISSKEFKTI